IFLYGDLGVGKTFFCQQIIKSITDVNIVSSPTYNIVNTYPYKKNAEIWHCDLYRINSNDEILELGILDNFNKKILLIEWPSLLESQIDNPIIFKIDFGKTKYERNVTINLPAYIKRRFINLDIFK
ncbi:MAG: tRNA (adenosine(37)-N6)-threonylcarbamoyltransferase complex ATPase subunit type 1 TsaE, partial [Alphaproteobacteria bacterium TMED54]